MAGGSQGSGASPSRETRELIEHRRHELADERQQRERQFVKGRWVTEESALHNVEARRKEFLQRRAPRKVARVHMYNQLESTDTGIETEDREVADRVTQEDIVEGADIQTQSRKFNLVLDRLGPYTIDFTANGTHLLLAGLRGHMANLHWKNFSLSGEVQLKDKISDAIFLVDHSMTAAAQKKYVYMYTKEGTEMHILSKFAHMDRLAYLPRHMLVAATSSTYSVMQYLDISTGQEIGAKAPAVMGNPTSCVAVNPVNGVVASCDLRGVVKFWSPTVADPLLQLKGHNGVIDDIRFHPNGRFFITLGGDHKLKVWDTRTLRSLEEYAITYTFGSLDISSKGLVALGGGTNVQIWKGMFSSHKPSAPYMKFGLGYGSIARTLRFCPFEDVLGVGHSRGFSALLVPGSGEANPDFFYANPHETERHRKERVVTTLLDKLPPDMISMDIQVPGVNEERLAEYNDNLRLNRKARAIREKKQRRADRSLGDQAPTGLLVDNDDEVDEDLGFIEKPKTRELKSKKEKMKERKMNKWDKKDSTDKVRSKQTMRQSRIVQQERNQRRKADRLGAFQKDDLNSEEENALRAQELQAKRTLKRQRVAEEKYMEDVRGMMGDASQAPAGQRRGRGERTAAVRSSSNAALRRLL